MKRKKKKREWGTHKWNWGMKRVYNVVIVLLMCFIPLDTHLKFRGTENWLNEWYWMEWFPSHSIPFYSILFLQNQTIECGSIPLYFIPPFSTNSSIAHRKCESLHMLLHILRRRVEVSFIYNFIFLISFYLYLEWRCDFYFVLKLINTYPLPVTIINKISLFRYIE